MSLLYGVTASVGGDPLADLRYPLRALALQGQGPPTQARSIGCPLLGKAPLGRECDGGLCVRMDGWHVPTKLRDPGR